LKNPRISHILGNFYVVWNMFEVNHSKAGTCSGNLFSVFLVVFSYSDNNV